MQLHPDGTLVVSATDLVGYLACDHLTTLELGRVRRLWDRPPEREDPEVVLLRERGIAHEQAYLDRLRVEGRTVAEIPRPEATVHGYHAAEAATLQAMRAGVGAVYQATLFDGRWLGYADFLVRVERPSDLGDWSYEVADTKLSRAVKASALLQVCSYSDRLAALQGTVPDRIHVVTGDGTAHTLALVDYAAYYRSVKARFEAEVFGARTGRSSGDPTPPRDPSSAATYPDPVEHCRVCIWFPVCMRRREADDHLSLVAGMTRAATETLVRADLPTLEALGDADPEAAVPDLNPRTLDRLRAQARVQLAGRREDRLLFELIEPRPEEPGKGLALLPEPSPLDLFFDIEADPWAFEGGLEYLLGTLTVDDGAPAYRPYWGHDPGGERAAFEAFIDEVMDRLARDPAMHVYHYGGYESGAIKRLMQRHATREDEVDRLLRGGVLVDLYTAVRQGIRASLRSYSLKQIEHFYLDAREGPVTEAGFSVLTYEAWLRDRDDTHLRDLADYNRDDCLSTLGLREWLEARRMEAIALGWAMDRPSPRELEPAESLAAQRAEVAERVEALRAGVSLDPAARAVDAHASARWLLASTLDYHRRESKPAWWRWFDLRDHHTSEELVETSDALGQLTYVADVETRRRSVVRRYAFPPQDHRFKVGEEGYDPAANDGQGEPAGQIVAIDDAAGTIDLLRGPTRLGHHPAALIPPMPFRTDAQEAALLRLADDVIERGVEALGPYRAARDLLLRLPPRRAGIATPLPPRSPDEPGEVVGRRLVLELTDGVLAIQGPPGTGKTYSGARMVLAALEAGAGPVAVTAQSHKTIGNVLEEISRAAATADRPVRVMQRCEPDQASTGVPDLLVAPDNETVIEALAERRVDVVGGTSWLFARGEVAGRFGLLVVDEAGQAALATVLSMSGCARSIVLLGDPNQLPQVTQGLHPDGSDASALEHVLDGATTLPDHMGLFLDRTWRMHPRVNRYISETFYDGRLTTHPRTAQQWIEAPGAAHGAGIRWLPVPHQRNAQRSPEEAAAVADIVAGLIREPWVDADGRSRELTIDDLLVVAPYNAQVATVQRAIEDRVGRLRHDRVGTVDKFQGREGAVAIYTMAASSVEDAPRGMEFLLDVHRLDVAVSRARATAIVVASPELLRPPVRTPTQMRLANALCRFVEVAAEQAAGDPPGPAPTATAPIDPAGPRRGT